MFPQQRLARVRGDSHVLEGQQTLYGMSGPVSAGESRASEPTAGVSLRASIEPSTHWPQQKPQEEDHQALLGPFSVLL